MEFPRPEDSAGELAEGWTVVEGEWTEASEQVLSLSIYVVEDCKERTGANQHLRF